MTCHRRRGNTIRAKDAHHAFPQRIDRALPIAPQMTGAMIAIHRVFGSCTAHDLETVGFSRAEIEAHGRQATILAYKQSPAAANDVRPHLSDEDIAAGLMVA
jgi:hypothetical protein